MTEGQKKKMGRPPLKKPIPKTAINIRLPDFLAKQVDELAYERRLSRTRTIEDIIEEYFKERSKKT